MNLILKEKKRLYRELVYFKNQCKRKTNIIKKIVNNIEEEIINSCEDCQLREKCLEENCIIFRIENIQITTSAVHNIVKIFLFLF